MIDPHTVFMVVDDSRTMRHATCTLLNSLGLTQIITANDGAEALQLLQTRHVDLVLSDWNMPVMSGLDLLKAVRSDERLFPLPFVMVTADAERERERVEEAIAYGVSGLLVKPYAAERLASRIEKALAWKPRRIAVATLAPDAAPADPMTPASKAAGQATVLVVDDTPDSLMLISELFRDEYRVRIAGDGEKALAICLSDTPPDLVLLDVMMPNMDGFEVARRMREHPTAENIPVIFITAMAGDDARLKGLALGAVDFVTKPIDPLILKPRVRNFMRFVKRHKQLQADYDAMLESARQRENAEHIAAVP